MAILESDDIKLVQLPVDHDGVTIKGDDAMVIPGEDCKVYVTGIGVGACEGMFWARKNGQKVSKAYMCENSFHSACDAYESIMEEYERDRGNIEASQGTGGYTIRECELEITKLNKRYADRFRKLAR